jgi:membrane fusion protein (multidrug efflux system)
LKLDGQYVPDDGKMNFVSERINAANGGFDARAQVANPDGTLRPGQFVSCYRVQKRLGALAVPRVNDAPMGKMVSL